MTSVVRRVLDVSRHHRRRRLFRGGDCLASIARQSDWSGPSPPNLRRGRPRDGRRAGRSGSSGNGSERSGPVMVWMAGDNNLEEFGDGVGHCRKPAKCSFHLAFATARRHPGAPVTCSESIRCTSRVDPGAPSASALAGELRVVAHVREELRLDRAGTRPLGTVAGGRSDRRPRDPGRRRTASGRKRGTGSPARSSAANISAEGIDVAL